LEIILAIFLSMSILLETIGVWARVLGSYNNEPTTGYSTHVRIATLGRFFILVSAPSLGFLVDSGIETNQIALIGFISFSFISISILFFIKYGLNKFELVYKLLNKKNVLTSVLLININYSVINKVFLFWVFLSFLFTATGIIVVNMLATIIPEYRAMVVQMSAVITMFGTIIHVFKIDPILSKAADTNKEQLLKLTIEFLFARIIAAVIISIIFLNIYIWM